MDIKTVRLNFDGGIWADVLEEVPGGVLRRIRRWEWKLGSPEYPEPPQMPEGATPDERRAIMEAFFDERLRLWTAYLRGLPAETVSECNEGTVRERVLGCVVKWSWAAPVTAASLDELPGSFQDALLSAMIELHGKARTFRQDADLKKD